jgi:aminomethyltransferase
MAKRTPFFEIHKVYQGNISEFAGWEMPICYRGIIDEHKTVRSEAGLFDVSHMGEIEVKGKDALVNLQKLLVTNIQTMSVSRVKYSALCYPDGGVVDDITIYRLAEDRFLLCSNAGNTEKDHQWILQNLEGDVEVINRSSEYAQLAIQGPKAVEVLQKLTPVNLEKIKYYWFAYGTIDGVQAIISRTGYSGEDGFELYFNPEFAIQVWERLMAIGKRSGLRPAGLGARDTLRLEMGFPLYGHELNPTISLLEAGLERFVDFDKPSFIGKETLLKYEREGTQQRLVGFRMVGEGIPRSRYEIYKDGRIVGLITSGTISPSLGKGIGLGYITIEEARIGNEVSVMIRGKKLPAVVVETPFYKRSLAKIYKNCRRRV